MSQIMRVLGARRALSVVGLVLLALVASQSNPSPGLAAPQPDTYSTYPLVSDAYLGANGSAVIEFAMIPGQPNQAIVARQNGFIYRVALDGSFTPQLWGNVSSSLHYGGEEGLLSVAFAPDFTSSGRVYLYYTPGAPTPTVLARYQATSTDLNESSVEVLLNIEEFAVNHNGGHIAFDSDGLLYLSLGDGGGGGDPNEKGQALNTLLGKVIRLDVSGPTGYAIPAGNPFSDGVGPIREEIFAYGFRNPFRMTIDPLTDDVWLGDVGQNEWEEVDRVVVGGNYGWDCWEGNESYEPAGCPAMNTIQFPRAVYDHGNGQAVTGGVIYRGTQMPELYGWYVYSDFYSGHIWAVNPADSTLPVHLMQAPLNVSSFTLMPNGEIAIVSYDEGVYGLTNDQDADGFTSVVEVAVGTDQADGCGFTPGAPNQSETWPADLVESNSINISDVLALKPVFNTAVPPTSARFDIVPGGGINISDVLVLKPLFNQTCTP